jgi:hypothetical protein
VGIYDNLNWLVWAKTEDGVNNKNKPESLHKRLYGSTQEKKGELANYNTPEEYKRAWEEIRRKHGNNS